MIYQLAIAATFLASASAGVFSNDPTFQKYMWEQFKNDHKKTYGTMDEETKRFGIFLANLKVADLRANEELKAGGSASHGITIFSDWTQEEFEAKMLGARGAKPKSEAEVAVITTPVNTTATLVDWTGKYTTPVKDQGYCGSCWAFSATEQIESDSMRTLGTSYLLSPEQITQCDSTSAGCNGGWTEHAYNYVKRAGGITTESNYPYTSGKGVTGTCKTVTNKVISVQSYTTINGESSMASYVQATGPLSVCLDASTWSSYTGGIVSKCGQNVDHCVQAVGVLAQTGGYWKVRNSWGTSWGEAGYIRLAYGQNTCNIASDPTYVAVSKL